MTEGPHQRSRGRHASHPPTRRQPDRPRSSPTRRRRGFVAHRRHRKQFVEPTARTVWLWSSTR